MWRRGTPQLQRRLTAHERARTHTSSSVVYMSTPRCVTQERNVTSRCEGGKIHVFFSMNVTSVDDVTAFFSVLYFTEEHGTAVYSS